MYHCPHTEIIVALDYSEPSQIYQMVHFLDPKKCLLKLGLQAFTCTDAVSIVDTLRMKGFRIFADLKLFDIPNTVSAAVRNLCELGVWGLTLHAIGGAEMLAAADDARNSTNKRTNLFAVTVLTSVGEQGFAHIGTKWTTARVVKELGTYAYANYVDGVVCSAGEVPSIKNRTSLDFKTICPGIRLPGEDAHDQKRITTPVEAHEHGANFIVIGRTITQSNDPKHTLDQIYSSLQPE